jgi:hypothetical protein
VNDDKLKLQLNWNCLCRPYVVFERIQNYVRVCTNGRKEKVAKWEREEHRFCGHNVEIIIINSVYYAFCSGCARNELD